MTIKAIPDGFHTLTPYLSIKGVPKVIEFLKNAFDAKEEFCHRLSDGNIMHAQIKIGDSKIMLGESCGNYNPMPAMLYMYVEDADAIYKKAIKAGGKSIMEPVDQFYGDRSCAVEDTAGNQWWIATHKEDVSKEELSARAEKFRKGQ